jgi:ATP-dependent protease ClpP protease subunit
MSKKFMFVATGMILFSTVSVALAASWGSVLGAATQATVQTLSPQAQTTVDQAKKLAAGAPQEDFIITKAKEFMAAGNYQPALDLANYVLTTLDSKSVDAKKIMADAKAALMKIAQNKLAQTQQAQQAQGQAAAAQQVKTDAVQTGNSFKSLFSTTK